MLVVIMYALQTITTPKADKDAYDKIIMDALARLDKE